MLHYHHVLCQLHLFQSLMIYHLYKVMILQCVNVHLPIHFIHQHKLLHGAHEITSTMSIAAAHYMFLLHHQYHLSATHHHLGIIVSLATAVATCCLYHHLPCHLAKRKRSQTDLCVNNSNNQALPRHHLLKLSFPRLVNLSLNVDEDVHQVIESHNKKVDGHF